MIGTKTIKLLQSLQKEELHRLGRFVRSPFFNYSRPLVLLFDYLRRCHPDFPEKKLDKKRIWDKVYPGQPFSDNKYWRLCTNFTKLAEKFLVALQLEREPNEEKKILIRALGNRNIYDLFEKETLRYLHDRSTEPFRDTEYYMDKTRLHFDYFFHPITNKHTLDDGTLLELMRSIDKQFALAKLRIGSELKNRESILSKKYQADFLEELFDKRFRELLSDNKSFRLFELLFNLYAEKENTGHFLRLKKEVTAAARELRKIDRSLFMTQLINYAIWQINLGNYRFTKDALDLYKISLEIDMIVEKGKIEEAVFGNIVTLGCHANEHQWVEWFIGEYSPYLGESVRAGTVVYSRAFVSYSRGDFDNTILLLMQHRFSSYHQVRTRLLAVRAIFENFLSENRHYEFLISQIEAFEKFLRRDDLQEKRKKNVYADFLKILKKIADHQLGAKKKKSHEQLLLEIQAKKNLTLKNWLLEKMEMIGQ
ncbi:MAG: hypothetical protein AAFZ15_02310 [Bacteroidota bacterium]